MAHPYHKHREHRVSHARVKSILKKAGGGDVPTVSSPPLQPLSPFEQYNVSAGQGKIVGPMKGMKDIYPNDRKEK